MGKTEKLKYTLFGISLIIVGIIVFIWNFIFSEIVSLGIIPLGAAMMVILGIVFIRRAVNGY